MTSNPMTIGSDSSAVADYLTGGLVNICFYSFNQCMNNYELSRLPFQPYSGSWCKTWIGGDARDSHQRYQNNFEM